jgi:hypothetical protein
MREGLGEGEAFAGAMRRRLPNRKITFKINPQLNYEERQNVMMMMKSPSPLAGRLGGAVDTKPGNRRWSRFSPR